MAVGITILVVTCSNIDLFALQIPEEVTINVLSINSPDYKPQSSTTGYPLSYGTPIKNELENITTRLGYIEDSVALLVKLNERRQSDIFLDMFTDPSFNLEKSQEQTFPPNFSTPAQSLKSNDQSTNSLSFSVDNVSAQPLSCNEVKLSATSFDQSQVSVQSASFSVDECNTQPPSFPRGQVIELKSTTQTPDPVLVPMRQGASLSLEMEPQHPDFIADNEQQIFQALAQSCFSGPITLNPPSSTQVPTTQPSLVQQPQQSGAARNLFMKQQPDSSASATVLDSVPLHPPQQSGATLSLPFQQPGPTSLNPAPLHPPQQSGATLSLPFQQAGPSASATSLNPAPLHPPQQSGATLSLPFQQTGPSASATSLNPAPLHPPQQSGAILNLPFQQTGPSASATSLNPAPLHPPQQSGAILNLPFRQPGSSASATAPNPQQPSLLLELTPEAIQKIRAASNPRKNFAANLVLKCFTEEVLKTSNVNGRKGKMQLDPSKISSIRRVVYSQWPLKPGASEEKDWTGKCTKAIDERNRRLNRKKSKHKKKRSKLDDTSSSSSSSDN